VRLLQLMSDRQHIQPNTLGAIAKRYGMDTRTLKGMIRLHPELLLKVQPYFDAKKNLLPPIIVELIYTTLGTPE